MLACLCCKKGDIGFKEPISAVKNFSRKEFENNEGEDYTGEISPHTTSSSQNGPEVYILPLTEVSLPVSSQPSTRAGQFLHQTDLGRQSLLYLKEVGIGWFGKVFLGEVNISLNSCHVVVKELKVGASIQDQMRFLEEAQPYRGLQHPNLVQCLAQFTEMTPYLLVMEFCQLGDVKGYLRTHSAADELAPDPSTLQRMACEVTSGLQHLHKHNYIHSDLALRNCLLSADLTVKIGDYGLSHNKYKKDYLVTPDQLWIPLRWIAPELIDDVHGNLLVVDQTKISNIWSLGVTLWELFEFGNQPYHQCSDKEVLTYAIKEQQLKLPKPLLNLPLSDRWYEVMQFCWLQPEQRPTADEVHLLLSYLCAKASSDAEEEFEKRWNAMKPSGSSSTHTAEVSSFPLLEQFGTDGFHTEVDDVLTVTETSQGLNFEYKWDHKQMDNFQPSPVGLAHGSSQYQEIYFPNSASGRLSLSVSPISSNSFYESKQQCSLPQSLQPPGVVPVISAHSPSVTGEYYIRIEEPTECNMELDYTMCSYSPEYEPGVQVESSSWRGLHGRDSVDDCENSPTISLTMEPLLGQGPPAAQDPWETDQYFSRNKSQEYYEHFAVDDANQYLLADCPENEDGWKVENSGENSSEDPLGMSPLVTSSFRDSSSLFVTSYDEVDETGMDKTYQPAGVERGKYPEGTTTYSEAGLDSAKTLAVCDPWHTDVPYRRVNTAMAEEGILLTSDVTSQEFCSGFSVDLAEQSLEQENKGSGLFGGKIQAEFSEIDLSKLGTLALPSSSHPSDPLTCKVHSAVGTENGESNPKAMCREASQDPTSFRQSLSDPELQGAGLCPEETGSLCPDRVHGSGSEEFVDPLLGVLVKNCGHSRMQSDMGGVGLPGQEVDMGGYNHQPETAVHRTTQLSVDGERSHSPNQPEVELGGPDGSEVQMPDDVHQVEIAVTDLTTCSPSEGDHFLPKDPDSSPVKTLSSASFAETDECSDDDDDADVTSGIFTDLAQDCESNDPVVAHKSLQKLVGTPDSLESLDIPSTTSSCDTFSPTSHYASLQPKAADSGYDTENFESPEFVLKEPVEQKEPEAFNKITKSNHVSGVDVGSEGVEDFETSSLEEKNSYRDSAYFSDYDTESERYQALDLEKDDLLQGGIDLIGLNGEHPASIPVPQADGMHLSYSEPNSAGLKREEGQRGAGGKLEHCSLTQSFHDGLVVESMGTKEVSVRAEKSSGPIIDEPNCCTSTGPNRKMLCSSVPAINEKFHHQDSEIGNETEAVKADYFICRQMFEEGACFSSEDKDVLLQNSCSSESLVLNKQVSLPKKGRLHKPSGCIFDGTELILEEQLSEQGNETVGLQCTEVGMRKFQPHSLNVEEKLESCIVPKIQSVQLSLELPSLGLNKEPRPAFIGEEGDEEDEDEDESDDSDEELGIYNIQEHSEESEEDTPTVPIVVTEKDDGRNLRSLLKLPNLMCETFCEDLERKKKAVSFYDDVTVYLFDQESPTGELSEQNIPDVDQARQHPSDHLQDKSCSVSVATERQNSSNESSHRSFAEESGGFEWDDDFPLVSVKSSLVSEGPLSPSAAASGPAPTGPEQTQVQQTRFSRFTVSPATLSRFSITQVSDSDIGSVGGSTEPGERE
ncbi:serine/threonine-protein kinase LMTK1-like isoform X2 [Pristis pectinata]|uniref:serine/threonine-protein kinase LMTK1-like isoform X2 n=1 Tax=Pristis pectinata TaxID=685728 RepID=UPI00223D384B|nr:serine/threonine-protein kinase LMTK1-like isoform X2 [Pristis pectinata]